MYLTNLIESTTVITWILLGLFMVSVIIQFIYFLAIYPAILKYVPSKRSGQLKPISVIICARNEADNLSKFLPVVLEQDYPDFEVIVVDDGSTDDTDLVLGRLSSEYKHLRFTSIPHNEKFKHGKKLAVTLGVKAAKNDHLLFIDADCYPASRDWIKNMAGRFSRQKQIVLGYGSYEQQRGLLNNLIRYETVFTAIQYLSLAIKGKPYMGVGRNLGYHKDLFFKNKGFSTHYHIQTGDDDLFINEVANQNNTSVEFFKESHTVSIPKRNLKDWIRQKQRHLKSGRYYTRATKFRIGSELISRLILYFTLITLCIISEWFLIVPGVFLLLMINKTVVFSRIMKRLNEKQLLLPSLIFDPVMPIILAFVSFRGLFLSNNQTWK